MQFVITLYVSGATPKGMQFVWFLFALRAHRDTLNRCYCIPAIKLNVNQ